MSRCEQSSTGPLCTVFQAHCVRYLKPIVYCNSSPLCMYCKLDPLCTATQAHCGLYPLQLMFGARYTRRPLYIKLTTPLKYRSAIMSSCLSHFNIFLSSPQQSTFNALWVLKCFDLFIIFSYLYAIRGTPDLKSSIIPRLFENFLKFSLVRYNNRTLVSLGFNP